MTFKFKKTMEIGNTGKAGSLYSPPYQVNPKEEVQMKTLILIALVLAGSSAVQAQGQSTRSSAHDQVYDMVFEKMRRSGVRIPQEMDSRKFFDDLDAKASASGRKLTPEEFWAEMQKRGSVADKGFDARRFWDELDASASSLPISKTSAQDRTPTIEQCKSGWSADLQWEQPLFNKLCGKGQS